MTNNTTNSGLQAALTLGAGFGLRFNFGGGLTVVLNRGSLSWDDAEILGTPVTTAQVRTMRETWEDLTSAIHAARDAEQNNLCRQIERRDARRAYLETL